ncbi:DUF2628 domain-containing protein [Rhizobium tubonense]|uniref:DUF2628 domain-containing protein n=1 Tax=Rhizobium tubonense TaxID=484088 RepID=A0A2W4C8V6_9HYPH|nr:DUF2628 domain-containing protein [Rhizobium tubonense]PZM09822.1 hypothetical protein CPY51_26515 [Rhizobium tubonense]
MATYLVLTSASGPGKDHEDTRFIRDGFSFLAFFIPGLWLLWQRMWIYAVVAFLLQGAGIALFRVPALWPAGFAVLLGVSVLAALEGRRLVAQKLVKTGWKENGLVSARRLAEAEEIYFAKIPDETPRNIPPVRWDIPTSSNGGPGGAALGLIGYDGGR